MYFGDAIVAKVYKAETGFTDGSVSNPLMDVLTPVHVLGTYRNKVRVSHIALKGVILPQTTMTVEIYTNGKFCRTVTISGEAQYVDSSSARPFGREYFGIDPFGFTGEGDPEAGFNYHVALDVNQDTPDIQIRFKMQKTGGRVQVDYYEVLAAESNNSSATQLLHI